MVSAAEINGARPLTGADLDRVVEIDAIIGGRKRRQFYEKRLDAALTEPKSFIYIGYDSYGSLHGFLQARLLEGEYGVRKPVAVLDNIGVEPGYQGQGIGQAMMQEFERILRHKDVTEIQTQADWRNQSIIGFLAKARFQLAPRQVLEREVSYMDTLESYETELPSAPDYKEVDFSDPSGDDAGALARDIVICRSLAADDLPALVRIHKRVTGSYQPRYYERKVKEVLDESGIRVSLVAELNQQVIGFIMARVDFGEFDRIEPTAVMDSIAVDPGFGHHQIGSALLSQLLANLATLRLDTIRTEVDSDHFDVLSFLMKNDFHTSQELAFSYSVN
jgi:ribosomal protein S18 acetylase RimI-like enzyme